MFTDVSEVFAASIIRAMSLGYVNRWDKVETLPGQWGREIPISYTVERGRFFVIM
jgi:hypothetical protein